MNQVGIAKFRICMSDARPGRAVMQLRLRDGPERIARTHGVLRWSSQRSDRRWHNNLRTYRKKVGIAKTGIQSEQFLPTPSIAETRCGKLPKRVTGFDGDNRQFSPQQE